jgi:hypothetical protein
MYPVGFALNSLVTMAKETQNKKDTTKIIVKNRFRFFTEEKG